MIETIVIIGGAILGLAGIIYAGYTKSTCIKWDRKTALQNDELTRKNHELKKENQALWQENTDNENLKEIILQDLKELSQKRTFQTDQLNELLQQKQIVNNEIEIKKAQVDDLRQNIETLSGSIKAAARASFEQYCDSLEAEYVLRERDFDDNIALLNAVYDERQNALIAKEKHLLDEQHKELKLLIDLFHSKQEDLTQSLLEEESQLQENLNSIRLELEKIRATKAAAMEAQLREEEIKNQATFYTLQLNEADMRDVAYLQSIEYNLREARPLRMLIWSTFYRDKVNDLAARVGAVGASGIYKITHIDSGISYIGQAKDIKERWVKEVKEALGIDAPATNKRCNFMREKGVDNFTFEILEKCSIAELNEKEKFYIDLYQTYEFGLNGNKGIG